MPTEEVVDKEVNKETGFLTDTLGKKSAMRLMSMMSMVVACFLGVMVGLSVYYGKGDNHMIGVYLTLIFLLAATAPKALQKYIESGIITKVDKSVS